MDSESGTNLRESSKAMELENLNKVLEEKEKVIQEMADQLSISKEELLAKAREVLELHMRIPKEAHTSSSCTEPDLQADVRKTHSMGTQHSELDSKTNTRKARSMGMPPLMGGESPSEAELRLVLLGIRAQDKQAVAEAILGRDMFPQVSTSTQTQWSESRQAEVAKRKVTVVDTPDWFNPAFSQRLRQDVRLCMELSKPGPHVFLLIIPVDTLEGEQANIPDKMEDIFGETCWEYTTILFTRCDPMGQRRMEEIIKGNQELQQLIERCENKYHLIDFSTSGANDSLLKIIDTIRGNNGGFYDSQMYLEAVARFREMETKMLYKKIQRKEKRKRIEKQMSQRLHETLQEFMREMKEQIGGHEGEIQSLHERMSSLERERKEERNEGKIRDIEEELEREAAKRKELEEKTSALKEKSEKEREEMEEKHKAEMEELRERYKRKARADVERNIMKMLLSDCHKRITSTIPLAKNHVVPLLGGREHLQSLIQINKNNNEGERERQRQDHQRQIEKMCMDMANLSQALLEKVRDSAEKQLYRTSEE